MPVKVSESAAREVSQIIRAEGLDAEKVRLRVGVKGGGCAGFNYILDLTETQRDSDEMWEYTYEFAPASTEKAGEAEGGVAVAEGGDESAAPSGPFTLRVVCDPKSYLYLNETEIDYKDEGMFHKGFVFNNPNASSSCGCGSSFAV